MSLARQALIFAMLVVVALGGWWAAERADLLQAAAPATHPGSAGGWSGARQGGAPVIVEPVGLVNDRVRLQSVGTGQAGYGVTIHPAVAGEVAEVAFASGQRVARGDVLLRLDDEAERLAVSLAKVEVKEAENVLARYQKAPSGAVSAIEVDAARTALDRTRLRLEEAEIALRYRAVRAPFDGVVGPSAVDPGDRVTTATAITTLDDRDTIIVSFDVAEVHADLIRPGDRLKVAPWSLRGSSFDGVVDSVGSRLDPVSRSLEMRARVANPEDLLRPGMSFAVTLDIAGHSYASVPELALLWSREGAYVWRVTAPTATGDATGPDRASADRTSAERGQAERVAVRVHRREGGRVLLQSLEAGDLSEGDLIVVEGVQRLRPGSAVQIVDTLSPPRTGS